MTKDEIKELASIIGDRFSTLTEKSERVAEWFESNKGENKMTTNKTVKKVNPTSETKATLLQRIFELEKKIAELEVEIRGPEGLQRHIGKIRTFVGMNN